VFAGRILTGMVSDGLLVRSKEPGQHFSRRFLIAEGALDSYILQYLRFIRAKGEVMKFNEDYFLGKSIRRVDLE
jgi:hypothetical protein